MSAPVGSSTVRKWWVNSTGTLTDASMRSWSQAAANVPVQKARPHSGSYSLSSWRGSAPPAPSAPATMASQPGSSVGRGGDQPVPVPDRPLVAEVLGQEREHRSDRLADALADRRADLGREQRWVLVVGADDLTRLGVRGQPGRDDASGREAGDDGRAPDDAVDEADQVVAHQVERVAAGRAAGSSLAAQVDGEGLEVLAQQAERLLVAPPRLGLAGDQQERRARRVAGGRVVELRPRRCRTAARRSRGRRRWRRGRAARRRWQRFPSVVGPPGS